ncbi:unnamed protein product [Lymnaea stagnalis]|uniref:Biogenesis of lysosome-related organelles complex 1 subunit 6 n=1 Tax=Lymnaea stagnalis TaxID=6523 RepID=A0AAV2H3Z5_LYMST
METPPIEETALGGMKLTEQTEKEALDHIEETPSQDQSVKDCDQNISANALREETAYSTQTSEGGNSSSNEVAQKGDKQPHSELKLSYDAELMMNGVYQDTDVSVDPATIDLLTNGFIARFMPSLQKTKSTIDQIKTSQSVLIETVQQETTKFTECQALVELEKTMAKAKLYHNKLIKLKRDMSNLHDKSKKLKKRAVKLQQQKQKEELTRAHNLEKEYEKERMLTARVASTSD